MNGDGYADLLIGARTNGNSGAAYLVLGGPGGWGVGASLANPGIVKYSGEAANDIAGYSMAGAGDVNGDGFADLLIGANGNNSAIGAGYLVFSDALSPNTPSFQQRQRLLGNSGDAKPVDFGQIGVRVDFSAGALSGESICARRHIFHPCNADRQLATPIWTVESNKVGAGSSINLRFKYTSAQIAGMTEANLKLWTRPAGQPCGTWTQVNGSTVDAAHNFVSATVSSLSQFTIAEAQPPPTGVVVQSFSVAQAGEPLWLVFVTAVLVIAAALSHAYLKRQRRSDFADRRGP